MHQVQETLRSLPKFMSGKCLLTSFSLWSGKDRGRLWQEQFGFDLEGGFEHNSVEQLSYCTCFLRKAGLRLATRVTRAQFVAKAHFGCVNVWLSFCRYYHYSPSKPRPISQLYKSRFPEIGAQNCLLCSRSLRDLRAQKDVFHRHKLYRQPAVQIEIPRR